jgi:hypothetical protein
MWHNFKEMYKQKLNCCDNYDSSYFDKKYEYLCQKTDPCNSCNNFCPCTPIPGPRGLRGFQGPQGLDGTQGVGVQGNQGFQGPQGPAGILATNAIYIPELTLTPESVGIQGLNAISGNYTVLPTISTGTATVTGGFNGFAGFISEEGFVQFTFQPPVPFGSDPGQQGGSLNAIITVVRNDTTQFTGGSLNIDNTGTQFIVTIPVAVGLNYDFRVQFSYIL